MEPLAAFDPTDAATTRASAELALVQRMTGGDRAAYDEFAERYFPGLLRFAQSRLKGDSDLALEMAQTAACKAIEKLDSFRGEAPLLAWLCSCCRNEIRMFFRSKQRRPLEVELDEESRDYEVGRKGTDLVDAEHRMLRNERAELVHLTLDALPRNYASALEWKYHEKASVREIAERLELTVKAAESLLTRARGAFRALHEELSEDRSEGPRSPDAATASPIPQPSRGA